MKQYTFIAESVDFFERPLFSKDDVTFVELSSIIKRLETDKDNSIHSPEYRELLNKKYLELKGLRVLMRRKALNKIPLKVVEDIAGSN